MNKILKWTFIFLGAGILGYLIFWIFISFALNETFETNYSKKDLINNYDLKSREILEVKNYMKDLVPPTITVEIEFDGNQTLSIFHVNINGHPDNNCGTIGPQCF